METFKDIKYNFVPRLIADNMLLNKHVKTITHDGDGTLGEGEKIFAENGRKAVFASPVVFDFVCNMLTLANFAGNNIEESGVQITNLKNRDHYLLEVTDTPFFEYFPKKENRCQFLQHLQKINMNWIIAKTSNGNGYEFRHLAPVQFGSETVRDDINNNFKEYKLHLFIAKAVFRPLLERDWQSGYIYLPSLFYPKIMQEGTGTGINKTLFKIIYKANILGLLKNTHEKGMIEMPKKEFLENVMPEQVKENGWLPDKDFQTLRQAVTAKDGETSAIGKIAKEYGHKFRLVENIFVGQSEDYRGHQRNIELFFTKPQEKPYS